MDTQADISQINFSILRIRFKRNFIKIAVLTSFLSMIVLLVLLNMANRYRVETKLAPVMAGGANALAGQLGGIASLAGLNLNQIGGEDKTVLAIETLRTRNFLIRVLKENDLIVPVFASKGWNKESGELIIDDEIYDVVKGKWVREPKEPYDVIPADEEIIEEFKKDYTVYQDDITGIVTIRFTSYSPVLSKKVVDSIVKSINMEMKNKDISDIKHNIEYIEAKIEGISNKEIKNSFYTFLEEEMKKLMIAEVKDEYSFKTLEPSFEPVRKSSPKRVLILLLSGVAFLFMSSLIFCLRD